MNGWCKALLGLSMLLPFMPGAVALDRSGRLFLADDIERRFNGRFLFTTSGDGTYAIFQKVEDPSGIFEGREVVCMMIICYVAIDTVASTALESVSRDQEHIEGVRRSFKIGQDAYESALKASSGEKGRTKQIWLDQISKIGRCIREKPAC